MSTPTPRHRPAERARRVEGRLFTLALVGVVAGTVAGFLLARADAERSYRAMGRSAAEATATAVEQEVLDAVNGLAGADALTDGSGLRVDVFPAFANDVLADEGSPGITLVEVVEAGEREAFEVELGRPISTLRDGELIPAPESSVLFPVVAVVPDLTARSATGLDFGAVAVRRESLVMAFAERVPVVSDALQLDAEGTMAVAVLRPVVNDAAGRAVEGFVAAGVTLEQLALVAQRASGDAGSAVMVDGEEELIGEVPPSRSQAFAATVRVPGQAWDLLLLPTGSADLTVAWYLLGGGSLAVAALLVLLGVTRSHQRRLAAAHDDLAVDQARRRSVEEVTGRLARALTGVEVVAALLEHLPQAVGASNVLVVTTDARGGSLVFGGLASDDGAPTPRLEAALVDLVGRGGGPGWHQSPMGWRGDAALQALAGDAGALATIPLVVDDVAGLLVVAYERVHLFEPDELKLLETLGVLAARALARAARYDVEHRAAVAFQEAALPSAIPTVPGLDIAAIYRPGARGATVGGDWYDVLVLDDGRVLLVVGDVVGHGTEAAAAMGRLRTAFQASAAFTSDPAALVRAVSQQAATIPNAFCATAICVVLDLVRQEATWCRAGHLPPLLVREGDAEVAERVGGPPLGIGQPSGPPVHADSLTGGRMLVLYSDGLIERRGEPIDAGFDRLRVVAGDLSDLPVHDFCDALVQALVLPEDQSDDLVVVVARIEGPRSMSSAARPASRVALLEGAE